MNTAMKKCTVLAILAVTIWAPVTAQNALPSRTLTIEGSYNPQATQAGKIMPVPDKPQLKSQRTDVSYLTQPAPNTTHQRQPMAVFSSRSDEVVPSALQGVARLGYGLRNLHDGLVDLGWRISDSDFLRVDGQMDGWSSKPDSDWRSRMYNIGLRTGYLHKFDHFDIGLEAGYSNSRYNYRPGVNMDSAKLADSRLMRRVNRADVALGANGRFGQVTWNAKMAGLWLINNNLVVNNAVADDEQESQFIIDAAASMPLMDGTAGLGLGFRHLSYDWTAGNGQKFQNFSTFTMSPYWAAQLGLFDFNFGFNMTVRSNIGPKFLASPMVTMAYRLNDEFSLLAGLTGGLVENDMRTLESISPYYSTQEQIVDGYDIVNLSMGARYESGTWVSLSGRLGYRRTLDEVFQVAQSDMLVTSALKQQNSNVLYADVNADMQFTDRAQVRFDFTYNNYMGHYPGYKMELKPAFDMSLYSRVNVMGRLDAMLTYRLMLFNWIEGVAMPAVNDLALTFDYDFMDNLSFYATVNKLAGGDFYYYAGYRALRPAFLLGATYRF